LQEKMARYKLTIEYDGTRYAGWQLQKGLQSIQGTLIDACKVIIPNQKVEIYGAGRTDQGVHALGQVAHLDVNSKRAAPTTAPSPQRQSATRCGSDGRTKCSGSDFHARHSAKHRIYLYQISRRPSAFGKKMVWWVKDPLDVQRMNQVAALYTLD
jgi:tRNA pseudouridine38-40 synthase